MSDPRERIKLLLALARSSAFESEARSARKKAGALMKRHGLTRKEVYQPTPLPRPVHTISGVDVLAATLKEISRREEMMKAHKRKVMKTICMMVIPYVFLVVAILFIRYCHG